MVCVPAAPNRVLLVKDCVTPDPAVQFPYTVGTLKLEIVMALVRADILTVPMFQGASIDTVVAAPALSKIAVSCARGKLASAGVPPDAVAHPVELQFCEPVKFQ